MVCWAGTCSRFTVNWFTNSSLYRVLIRITIGTVPRKMQLVTKSWSNLCEKLNFDEGKWKTFIYSKIPWNISLFIVYRWLHFSRLPFLPEIDALKEDISIINDTFKHLHIDQTSEKNYVEAYKYTFSRTGESQFSFPRFSSLNRTLPEYQSLLLCSESVEIWNRNRWRKLKSKHKSYWIEFTMLKFASLQRNENFEIFQSRAQNFHSVFFNNSRTPSLPFENKIYWKKIRISAWVIKIMNKKKFLLVFFTHEYFFIKDIIGKLCVDTIRRFERRIFFGSKCFSLMVDYKKRSKMWTRSKHGLDDLLK